MVRAAKALIAAVSVVWAGVALAQDAAKFPLELNRLEQDGEICRVYLKVKNPAPEAINEFKLDLVFFDKGEIIRNRLYVELGPMVASKTAVRLFDIPDFQCGELGSILVNDVVACTAPSGADLNCLARLELSSKAGISLDY
ncbi:MAG: hypothetical protein ACKVH0_04775 [Alphaproteobacteria bacterium]